MKAAGCAVGAAVLAPLAFVIVIWLGLALTPYSVLDWGTGLLDGLRLPRWVSRVVWILSLIYWWWQAYRHCRAYHAGGRL